MVAEATECPSANIIRVSGVHDRCVSRIVDPHLGAIGDE